MHSSRIIIFYNIITRVKNIVPIDLIKTAKGQLLSFSSRTIFAVVSHLIHPGAPLKNPQATRQLFQEVVTVSGTVVR